VVHSDSTRHSLCVAFVTVHACHGSFPLESQVAEAQYSTLRFSEPEIMIPVAILGSFILE
jgi:hypothetical protein